MTSIALLFAFSFVLCLLGSGGPPQAPRFVITIIVDPVDGRVRRWPWPNVRKKSLEPARSDPLSENPNTPAAIVLKTFVFWIQAPLDDISPAVVFSGLMQPVSSNGLHEQASTASTATSPERVRAGLEERPTVAKAFKNAVWWSGFSSQEPSDRAAPVPLTRNINNPVSGSLRCEATTGLGIPALEVSGQNLRKLTTVTFASPLCMSAWTATNSLDDRKPAESTASKIVRCSHFKYPIGVMKCPA